MMFLLRKSYSYSSSYSFSDVGTADDEYEYDDEDDEKRRQCASKRVSGCAGAVRYSLTC